MSIHRPQVHIQAWKVLALLDYPAGSARGWPGKGKFPVPQGRAMEVAPVFPAETSEEAKRTFTEMARKEVGHRYVHVMSTIRVPALEDSAAEYVAEWLERAKYDARQQEKKNGQKHRGG